MKQNIYVKTCGGRFANQFWQWAVALSYRHKYNVDVNKYYSNSYYFKDNIEASMKTLLQLIGINIDYFSADPSNVETYNNYYSKYSDKENLLFAHYLQNYSLLDEEYLKETIKFPEEIINKIKQDFPNIENSVVLHFRRGDYMTSCNYSLYNVLTIDYIKNVYQKHFKGLPVIVISDDISYCRAKLNDLCDDIQFSTGNELYDFILLTMSYGNICSSSSFSTLGSILNKYSLKKIVIPQPYYRNGHEESLIPPYAIREELKK